MTKKSSSAEFSLSTQTVTLGAIAWAVIALLFFLLFSVPLPGQERPEWYSITTYLLEEIAFLGAGILCFRNWQSLQIVSGRMVWLAFGLGMFSFFIGNLVFGYWELGLKEVPDVTPADFFFLATYVLWGWGMLQAVISRQLGLTLLQWLLIAVIFVGSVSVAYFLVYRPSQEAATLTTPTIKQPILVASHLSQENLPWHMATVSPVPDALPEVPGNTGEEESSSVPSWAVAVKNSLAPLAPVIIPLYIVGDVLLVVMATALLLAFWGGRFSLSWRFIAAAAFSFYIADLWFFYAIYNITDYETGALPEVFWIFSPCLFAIGATLEYDLSTRSRRVRTRRAT